MQERIVHHYLGKHLDQEEVRRSARVFSRQEAELSSWIDAHYPYKDARISDNMRLSSSMMLGHYSLHYSGSEVSGVYFGSISLLHGNGFTLPYSRYVVGQPDDILNVGLHTDEETMEQALTLTQRSSAARRDFHTDYLFDHRGNYTKVSQIPRSIRDNRVDINDGRDLDNKQVISSLTAADLERVSFVLHLLRRGLHAAQENIYNGAQSSLGSL